MAAAIGFALSLRQSSRYSPQSRKKPSRTSPRGLYDLARLGSRVWHVSK